MCRLITPPRSNPTSEQREKSSAASTSTGEVASDLPSPHLSRNAVAPAGTELLPPCARIECCFAPFWLLAGSVERSVIHLFIYLFFQSPSNNNSTGADSALQDCLYLCLKQTSALFARFTRVTAVLDGHRVRRREWPLFAVWGRRCYRC